MARRVLRSSAGGTRRLQFGVASFDLLSDVLINLNNANKYKLNNLAAGSGDFKNRQIIECIFLMTKDLGMDPLVGYCAIDIFERFMLKHIEDQFTTPTTCGGASAGPPSRYQEQGQAEFLLKIFSCVQIASKTLLNSGVVNNSVAVQFLHNMGHTLSKKSIMESELQILKVLDFNINVPNPLTYVEILLEVLGHNEPSTPTAQLYHICVHVLQFTCLQRTAIYESLLRVTTQSISPSQEQREMFVTVTEDCMLLGVSVITVAAVIFNISNWDQVIDDLSLISGILQRSIKDFSHVILEQVIKNSSPILST